MDRTSSASRIKNNNSARIKVAIRLRPFLDHEVKNGYLNSRISISQNRSEVQVKLDDNNNNNTRTFQFDHTFSQQATQDAVYKGCEIDKLVEKAIEGYHCTVFAYGQTGSGKTFTMQGINDDELIQENGIKLDGIMPKLTNSLFSKIKSQSRSRTYSIYVSYLQIYNEKIYDLLNPSSLNPRTLNSAVGGLRLRWNKNEQFSVQNLFIFECKSAEEVGKYMTYGLKNRINSAHKLNMNSSRSHSIFTIRVESFDHQNPAHVLNSKIELVDLAGSERIGLTGTEGRLAKESIDINKSLFTLRQVISTLADWSKGGKGTNNQQHIPYRDSKLTSILKQSIGGNSYCLMIACISPHDSFIQQNLSTLSYATKATLITNQPVINDDPRTKQLNDLKTQIKDLHEELRKANKHIEIITAQKQSEKQAQANNQRVSQTFNGSSDSPPKAGSSNLIEASNTQVTIRKKLSQKLAGPVNYDQFSDRLVESINMVRELLKSNKDLREQLELAHRKLEEKDLEIYDLEKENEQLRETIAEQKQTQNTKKQESSALKAARYLPRKVQHQLNDTLGTTNYDAREYLTTTATSRLPNQTMTNLKGTAQFPSTSKARQQPSGENTYNSFNSLEINNIYLNETGMDSMPTNFNKREINTAQGERHSHSHSQASDKYRNTFTSGTQRKTVDRRSGSGYKYIRVSQQYN